MTAQGIPTIEVETVLPDPVATADAERLAAEQEERDAAEIQAMSEGVDTDPMIEFKGKTFRVADSIGLVPLMKFSFLAARGADTDDDPETLMTAMATMYEMLRDCLHSDDWDRFLQHAADVKATEDDMMPLMRQAIQIMTARPTKPGSDSSASPATNTRRSTDERSRRASDLGMVPVSELLG